MVVAPGRIGTETREDGVVTGVVEFWSPINTLAIDRTPSLVPTDPVKPAGGLAKHPVSEVAVPAPDTSTNANGHPMVVQLGSGTDPEETVPPPVVAVVVTGTVHAGRVVVG